MNETIITGFVNYRNTQNYGKKEFSLDVLAVRQGNDGAKQLDVFT